MRPFIVAFPAVLPRAVGPFAEVLWLKLTTNVSFVWRSRQKSDPLFTRVNEIVSKCFIHSLQLIVLRENSSKSSCAELIKVCAYNGKGGTATEWEFRSEGSGRKYVYTSKLKC